MALNAGAAIYTAGCAPSLAAGVARALELQADGSARRKLDAFVALTQSFGKAAP